LFHSSSSSSASSHLFHLTSSIDHSKRAEMFKNLKESILSAWDSLTEDFLIHSDRLTPVFSGFLCILLNSLLLCTCFGILPHNLRLFVGVLLIGISFVIAGCFISKSKTIQIDPSYVKTPLPNFRLVDTGEPVLRTQNLHGGLNLYQKRSIGQLSVWSPHPSIEQLFCYFSPIQVAIVLTATEVPWLQKLFHITLAFLTILMLVKVLQKFRENQAAEEIIHKQLLDLNNNLLRRKPIDDAYYRGKPPQ